MYCPRKPNAKRKGPWSDGLLSVKGRACALQNMDAKSVSKALVSGCKDLKEGSTIEVGKFELEVMSEVPREQFLAGSFFIPAAAAAAAATQPPAATSRMGYSAGKDRKRAAESSGRSGGNPGEGVAANKRAASMESRLRLGNEDAVCLNPTQNGKGITKIYLDPYVGTRMRPHQVEGVRFMLESVLEVRVPGCSGCVLADEMGLGKTLQVIALIWTLLNRALRAALSCARRWWCARPSLVDNWGAEFRKWLGTERLKALVVNSSFTPTEAKFKIADFKHGMAWCGPCSSPPTTCSAATPPSSPLPPRSCSCAMRGTGSRSVRATRPSPHCNNWGALAKCC
ncbi:hypothetical protein CLOP_g7815 [Closterium sp. NIES-67]|nr:hypothetical protein CLOP_g7815 [Closterium sp. NIES-67]